LYAKITISKILSRAYLESYTNFKSFYIGKPEIEYILRLKKKSDINKKKLQKKSL